MRMHRRRMREDSLCISMNSLAEGTTNTRYQEWIFMSEWSFWENFYLRINSVFQGGGLLGV